MIKEIYENLFSALSEEEKTERFKPLFPIIEEIEDMFDNSNKTYAQIVMHFVMKYSGADTSICWPSMIRVVNQKGSNINPIDKEEAEIYRVCKTHKQQKANENLFTSFDK